MLFAFAAVLAFCVFVRLICFYTSNARAERLVSREAARGKLDPNEMEKFLAKTKELAEELKKKNIFVPTPKEEGHPIKAVTGIFGDEALVEGKWYKVGDKIKDAEIIAIEATEVKIKWKDNVKSFAPIAATVSSGPKTVVKKKTEEGDEAAKQTAKQAVTTEAGSERAAEEDPFAWLGVELTDSQREKLELVWSKIPEEFKEQAKQQWNSMTDEQKQEALDQLDQMPMDVLEQEIDEMSSRM